MDEAYMEAEDVFCREFDQPHREEAVSDAPIPVPAERIRPGIQESLDYANANFRGKTLTELKLYVAIAKAYCKGWHDGYDRLRRRPPESPTGDRKVEIQEIREVFDYWVKVSGKARAKLTSDRRIKVRARLKDGYAVDDLKSAIRGNAAGAYVAANGHKYNDLTLICRSGSHVERYMSLDTGQGDVRSKVLG
jgi:hypothetical protein